MKDLDAGVECILNKFFFKTINWQALKTELDKLEHFAISNTMKFNKDKFCVLHLGKSNAGHRHGLENEWLESSSAELSRAQQLSTACASNLSMS